MNETQYPKFLSLMNSISNELEPFTNATFGEMVSVLKREVNTNSGKLGIYFHQKYYFEEEGKFSLSFHSSVVHDCILVTLNISNQNIVEKIFNNYYEVENFIMHDINIKNIKKMKIPTVFLELLSENDFEIFNNEFYKKKKEITNEISTLTDKKNTLNSYFLMIKAELENKQKQLYIVKANKNKFNGSSSSYDWKELNKEEDDLIKRIEQIISEMNVLQDKIIMISELIEGNKNKKFWEMVSYLDLSKKDTSEKKEYPTGTGEYNCSWTI